MKILLSLVLFVLGTAALSAQNGLRLVGHLDQKHGVTSGVNYSGSWGYVAPDGREYAILGTATGTAIIDISDTADIHEIAHIPGPTSLWREMRTYRERLYVVTEAGGGTQIIDLSHLPASAALLTSFIYTAGVRNTARAHTIEIFDGYLYLNGCGNWGSSQAVRGAVIFSLADPDNPQFAGEYSPNYFHDSYVRNDTIFGASVYSNGGVYIADIKNKSAPIPIGKISYPGSGTHNVWTTKDGRYLISTDEIGSTEKSLKFWDLGSLPTIPATPATTYLFSGFGDVEHNVTVRGDYAYTAWYTAGIVVVDVTEPITPFTAGWYDSSNDILFPPGNYDGVWAVYPYFWSGKVTAGDMQNGLYVFMFDSLAPRTPAALAGPADAASYCDDAPVTFRWTRVADPVRDPVEYRLHIVGPGVDTLYRAGADTSITIDPAPLGYGTFQWSVVTKDDANAVATQDTFTFNRPPRIPVVTGPNGGEVLKADAGIPVTWSSGCTDSVELSYSTDAGASWMIVEPALPALPASYNWTVPRTVTAHGRFRVRALPDTARADASDGEFAIYNSHSVTLLSPLPGDVWKAGSARTISWTSGLVTHVKIEYSTPAIAGWQSVVADTPATSGSAAWLVPNAATTQAKVRVVDLEDTTVYGETAGPFTIWPMTMDLSSSWNLVSFPGIPSDPAAAANFPGAASALYRYALGYAQEDSIHPGRGYWLRYDSAQTIPLNGAAASGDTIPILDKWSIIGPLSEPVAASSITALPATMTLSAPYGFRPDSGYFVADTLRPGQGYWIRASETGEIILLPTLTAGPAASSGTEGEEIVFADASGVARSLFSGSEGAELPPPPPAGLFDVRFASQRRSESIAADGAPIEIRSGVYPVRVSLRSPGGGRYRLVERINGVERASYPLFAAETAIPSEPLGALFLEPATRALQPKSFSLRQNWPNPFNPVTTITFDLLEETRVSVKVYSLLGAEVATLVDGVIAAGDHRVDFDAANLPSGVYLCRLRTAAGTEMRKMVLAR